MSALSDEFEKWWKAVSNDEHVPIGAEDYYAARLAWKAAIAADRAARAELVECGCLAGECESKPAATCRMTTEIRQNGGAA